ncbi:hypothetical protein M3Y95_00145300 [Aphelenchoides besseyi]|nr:hypothetical protein M3Y95_00145300 [Aphelenchoides besseyi]
MIGSWYERCLLTITIIAATSQFYVIFLIQKKSPKSMMWDFLFTLVMGLGLQSYPIVPLLGGSTRGLAGYFGEFSARLVEASALYTGSQVIISQDYCLIFRCILIRANKKTHDVYVSWPSRIFWFLVHQAIALPIGFGFYLTFLPKDLVSGRLKANNVSAEATKTDMPVIVIDYDLPYTWQYFFVLVSLMVFSELLSVTLIYLILSTLKRTTFSKQTTKLHYQLITHLIVLLIIPLVLIIGPCCICVILLYFNIYSTENVMKIGLTMLTLYGPTNAFATILLVGPYRSFTFRAIRRFLHATHLQKTRAIQPTNPPVRLPTYVQQKLKDTGTSLNQ